MVYRTEVEMGIRTMIAQNVLKAPMSSLYKKLERRHESLAHEVSALITDGEEGERIFANIQEREEDGKARAMRVAIDQFKGMHPKYGEILENLIQETRKDKNTVLVYGLKNGFKLGTEDYFRVMSDLGFDKMTAGAFVPHLLETAKNLKKPVSEQEQREILLDMDKVKEIRKALYK